MYSKLSLSIAIILGTSLGAATGRAQTAPQKPQPVPVPVNPAPASSGGSVAAPAPPSNAKATLRGTIADPTGALIPGATVTITDAKGRTVATATADSAGNYEIHTLPAGSYTIAATFPGFAPFVAQNIAFTPGQIKRINIAMAIQVEQQSVVVSDETPTVSVQADSNASSLVIKGADLDALSDDPDELSNELSALAGPSAGPNGGQIYIDGFTGGQLPPKSSIREIRINQNPYSAEFDALGYGRIEILTKPGTDKLHGQFFIMGNDSSFNTGNPFTKDIQPYYSYQYNGTVSGSLSKNISFFFSGEHRSINNDSLFDTPCDDTGNCCLPDATSACTLLNGTIPNPHSRTNIAPRFDIQIGKKNTLTVRYQYYHDSESGEIGSTQRPSLSDSTDTNDNNLQISDTEVISDHIVNETRFQYDRVLSTTTPKDTSPTISVQLGPFTAGGNPSQFVHDHTDRWEFQNLTTMSLGKHAVKFGTRLRDSRDANYADSGFNGSFTFANNADYASAVHAAIAGTTSTVSPTFLTYSTTSNGAAPKIVANVFDGAAFIQDDWSFNPRLTLSGGLRFESQNHVADHSDWAPRVSMAYALDGSGGKQAKTVLRAGYGIFYNRLGIGNFSTIDRSDIEDQYTLNAQDGATISPDCFTSSFTTFNLDACAPSSGTAAESISRYSVAPGYRSPYAQQFGTSIERQISKAQTATLTFLHTQGDHQLVEINANAPYISGNNPADGYQYQYYTEGIFKQNQLIFNTNARFSPKFNIFGFYTLSFANTDGAGGGAASQSNNLNADYGRANFVSHNSVFLIANYTGPWGLRFNPFLIASEGKPYNITISSDRNGDSFFNDRPYVANASACTAGTPGYYQTAYGCLDTNSHSNSKEPNPAPPSGETLLPINAGNGPALIAVNLRVSRAFGIGPKLAKTDPNAGQAGGPPGGGPPGGGRGGNGGGGFGYGGGGRGGPGGMFAPTVTNRKYTLNVSAMAQNLFNDIDNGTPIGVVGSPNFGKSTSLQAGPFSSGAAARRIFLQAVFSF